MKEQAPAAEQERVIGEDGLDFNDHAAVSRWISNRLDQHRESEEQYRQQLVKQGIDPDEKPQGELDLSAMPEQARKMVEDGLREYEQMEAEFRQQLASVRPRERKSGGMSRWTKL